MRALVLGGGNALGAYHGGVVEAVAAAGAWPDWVAGSSIGGIVGALMAGNPPERRLDVVREFWRRAALADSDASWVPETLRKAVHLGAALQARIIGRPRLFHLRLSELMGGDGDPSLYDRAPMQRVLAELIDFGRLNGGEIRLSVLAVDAETGEEVTFDTARQTLTIDHLMATSALIPDFRAVEVDGRAFADGGLAANTPVDLVLAEQPGEPLACFAADPFPITAPRPRRLADAAERQSDLVFACQTARTLRAMRQLWEARHGPPGAVYLMHYAYQEGEVAMKSYDFSQSSLDRRWSKGRGDMERALQLWRVRPPEGPGLAIYNAGTATEAEAA